MKMDYRRAYGLLALVTTFTASEAVAQQAAENLLLGPTQASQWDLEMPYGLPMPGGLLLVMERNEQGALSVVAVHGFISKYTPGDIWIEPDERTVTIGVSIPIPENALRFTGGLSADQRSIEGECTWGWDASPCRLARRVDAVADPPIPIPGVRVVGMQFFEGPAGESVPIDERIYRTGFSNRTSRTIRYDLRLEHPAPAQRISFDLEATWYRSDGSVLTTQAHRTFVDPGWLTSNHYQGWGAEYPGAWQLGRYQIDLSVGGRPVATGYFDVFYDSPPEVGEAVVEGWVCEVRTNADPANPTVPGAVFGRTRPENVQHLILLVVGNPNTWGAGSRGPGENLIDGEPPSMRFPDPDATGRLPEYIIGPPGQARFRHALDLANAECAKWRQRGG